ncbi:MAG: hypothetical protein U0271_32730 [Polyangiaceae bacterium]
MSDHRGRMAALIPEPRDDDDEDVHWALSTATALLGRGESTEALKWLRRAAESASDSNRDARALELFKAAADFTSRVQQEAKQQASAPMTPAAPAATPAPAAVATPVPSGAPANASAPRVPSPPQRPRSVPAPAMPQATAPAVPAAPPAPRASAPPPPLHRRPALSIPSVSGTPPSIATATTARPEALSQPRVEPMAPTVPQPSIVSPPKQLANTLQSSGNRPDPTFAAARAAAGLLPKDPPRQHAEPKHLEPKPLVKPEAKTLASNQSYDQMKQQRAVVSPTAPTPAMGVDAVGSKGRRRSTHSGRRASGLMAAARSALTPTAASTPATTAPASTAASSTPEARPHQLDANRGEATVERDFSHIANAAAFSDLDEKTNVLTGNELNVEIVSVEPTPAAAQLASRMSSRRERARAERPGTENAATEHAAAPATSPATTATSPVAVTAPSERTEPGLNPSFDPLAVPSYRAALAWDDARQELTVRVLAPGDSLSSNDGTAVVLLVPSDVASSATLTELVRTAASADTRNPK